MKTRAIDLDLDRMLSVPEFLAWIGKRTNDKTRRWAGEQARSGRIPAVKLGKEWFFHPRTVLEQKTT